MAALAVAVKLLRSSAPEEQVKRRLKFVQQSEFAPSELESAADSAKMDRLQPVPLVESHAGPAGRGGPAAPAAATSGCGVDGGKAC